MNGERVAARRKLSIEHLKEPKPTQERERPRVDEEADTAPMPVRELADEGRRRKKERSGSDD